MLQVTIVTLSKRGKPSDTPTNFRHISLLNIDIKLYSKVWAKWLLVILLTLINVDQVGFIKVRQAPDGTRCILNIWRSNCFQIYNLNMENHMKTTSNIFRMYTFSGLSPQSKKPSLTRYWVSWTPHPTNQQKAPETFTTYLNTMIYSPKHPILKNGSQN